MWREGGPEFAASPTDNGGMDELFHMSEEKKVSELILFVKLSYTSRVGVWHTDLERMEENRFLD